MAYCFPGPWFVSWCGLNSRQEWAPHWNTALDWPAERPRLFCWTNVGYPYGNWPCVVIHITLYTGLKALNPQSSDSRSTYLSSYGSAFPTHRKKKNFELFLLFLIHDMAVPSGPGPPLWGDTLKHTTFGETPLDERSASRTNLYMTTHNTQNSKPFVH